MVTAGPCKMHWLVLTPLAPCACALIAARCTWRQWRQNQPVHLAGHRQSQSVESEAAECKWSPRVLARWRGPAVTIYTPLLQIQPIAIGGGPQDALVGFDATGAMCTAPR